MRWSGLFSLALLIFFLFFSSSAVSSDFLFKLAGFGEADLWDDTSFVAVADELFEEEELLIEIFPFSTESFPSVDE